MQKEKPKWEEEEEKSVLTRSLIAGVSNYALYLKTLSSVVGEREGPTLPIRSDPLRTQAPQPMET